MGSEQYIGMLFWSSTLDINEENAIIISRGSDESTYIEVQEASPAAPRLYFFYEFIIPRKLAVAQINMMIIMNIAAEILP